MDAADAATGNCSHPPCQSSLHPLHLLFCTLDLASALICQLRFPFAELPGQLVTSEVERGVNGLGLHIRMDVLPTYGEMGLHSITVIRLGHLIVHEHEVSGDDFGVVFQRCHDSSRVCMYGSGQADVART